MSVEQLFSLSGKVALVTGGSRGLGLQMAEALGVMGAKLALIARKQAELDHAAAHLAKAGVEVLTFAADLASPDAIPAVVDTVLAKFGAIDILVNNAGAAWAAPAEDYPEHAWHKVMRVNVDAMFFMSQRVGKATMIPRRSGKIINIASIAGLTGNPAGIEAVAYNTSKGAVVNFTRALAAEWGKYNINVNALCPGFFATRMSQGLLDRLGGELTAATPLGRLGGEDDLMGAALFLASEASRHVTGQTLAVDGGASII